MNREYDIAKTLELTLEQEEENNAPLKMEGYEVLFDLRVTLTPVDLIPVIKNNPQDVKKVKKETKWTTAK